MVLWQSTDGFDVKWWKIQPYQSLHCPIHLILVLLCSRVWAGRLPLTPIPNLNSEVSHSTMNPSLTAWSNLSQMSEWSEWVFNASTMVYLILIPERAATFSATWIVDESPLSNIACDIHEADIYFIPYSSHVILAVFKQSSIHQWPCKWKYEEWIAFCLLIYDVGWRFSDKWKYA